MTTFEALLFGFTPAISGSPFRGGQGPRPTPLILLLVCTIVVLAAAAAHAAGVVVNCGDDTELTSALSGSGTVTFNCGGDGSPATIALRSTKTISAPTTIDGGGKITLSGEHARRLFFVNAGASLDLRSIVLEAGFSKTDGGAVYNAGFLALDGATIRDSGAQLSGGAIATVGDADLTDATLTNNAATNGGALVATTTGAQVTIANSVLSENQVAGFRSPDGRGGAIFVSAGATVNVYSSDLHTNTATDAGGAIANVDPGSSLLLQNSSVYDNGAPSGAGVFNLNGSANLTMVTLSENKATVTGGGMKNEGGTANLTNVTISGNSAFGGGGLYNYNATANLTNVSVVNNISRNIGGGISNSSALTPHLNLKNVLVASSPAGGNCYFGKAPDTSQFNLSSDSTCSFGSGRDNLALKLGPLETNGGTILTHRLQPGSPAIDAGTTIGCPSIDARIVGRYYGHSCEVGAVEYVPCDGAPTAPVLLAPAMNEKLADSGVLLDWAGPDCATHFSVVVRLRRKAGPIVFSQDNIEETEVTTSELPRGRYFWQVTACNASGCTVSEWRRFKSMREL